MKKIVRSALLLMIMLTPNFVSAGDISGASLAKLMALSGLNKQVAEFPGIVMAGMEQANQQGSSISEAEFKEMQRSIIGSFVPSEILATIADEIKKNISESEAKNLLAWYESDLGKRITKAEEDASTPEAYQEMLSQAQSLLADEKRVKRAIRLDKLLKATDITMQLQTNTGIAVLTAIAAVQPNQQINIEAFKAQISAQEKEIRANAEQLTIISFVYSYKNIDVAGLDKYIAFLELSGTRKFNDSVITGLQFALDRSIDKMAKSLAVAFKKYSEKGKK